MTTIKNTQTELDTAEAEALAAEQQEATLERRVLDGDDTVSADELGTAATGSRWARLRATAAKNRKAKAERDAQAALENSVRDEWSKIQKAGTAAADRNRDAAALLEEEVTVAVEKFAATLADRKAVADGLMAQARAVGAQRIQPSDRTTERGAIYIYNTVFSPRLMIDGKETVTGEAPGIILDRVLRDHVTGAAKKIQVLGRQFGNW